MVSLRSQSLHVGSHPQRTQVAGRGGAERERPRNDRRARMSRISDYATRPLARIAPAGFGAALVAVLAMGWLNRDDDYLVADSGLGYWLGIVGASLMLLLLLYPLRKRMSALRSFGSVAVWFRVHMVLGLVGPALILFHSNFKLGSLNSNVALAAMLIVATSGVAGRYLYGKIHLGLYGRKVEVRQILADIEMMRHALGDDLAVGDRIIAQLNAFAAQAFGTPRGLFAAACTLPVLAIRAGLVSDRALREVRSTIADEARRNRWSRTARQERFRVIAELVAAYIAAVNKAATFAFYDRLFGFWHVLHLPLFVILIFAASLHVVTAHLF
jgi:hypothetical protein